MRWSVYQPQTAAAQLRGRKRSKIPDSLPDTPLEEEQDAIKAALEEAELWAQQRAKKRRVVEYPVGSLVRLAGLRGRCELNRRMGKVVHDYQDSDSVGIALYESTKGSCGCNKLRMERDRVIKCDYKNLAPLEPGCRVRLCRLRSHPDKNTTVWRVVRYAQGGRYHLNRVEEQATHVISAASANMEPHIRCSHGCSKDALQEAAWGEFEKATKVIESMDVIPWPTVSQVKKQLTADTTGETLKRMRMRYHPDKFMQKHKSRISQRMQVPVMERVTQIMALINHYCATKVA